MKAKNYLYCLISGVLLAVSFSFPSLWVIAWFGFVPLFFVLRGKSLPKVFFLAYLSGIIFWSGTIYWLIHVTLPGTLILILYLALYFGVFGLVISSIAHRRSSIATIAVPAVWVLLEYCRSHLFTGFPWALLGYSQSLNLPVIQIADITGAWGVSFLIVMVNVVIYQVAGCRLQVAGKRHYLLPLALLLFSLCYGFYKLCPYPAAPSRPLRISVIQGNIPQELKWHAENNDFIMNKYLRLTAQVAKDEPDLVIWPEASVPDVLGEASPYQGRLASCAKGTHTALLFGAVTKRRSLYYNSALLVSRQGELLKSYDKIHLVPFGEYIPLRKTFAFLETIVPIGDIAAGREYTIFEIPARPLKSVAGGPNPKSETLSRFGVLICFEDLFPELSRRFVKNGAGFLVNITNDAWYKQGTAPWQHLQASVFRAVENRVFLVRSANTGISGFIAPSGKILALIRDKQGRDIFVDGSKTEKISGRGGFLSFYTCRGDIFILVCFLFAVCGIIALRKRQD